MKLHLIKFSVQLDGLAQQLLIILLTVGLAACGSSGGSSTTPAPDNSNTVNPNTWAWVSGVNGVNQAGSYGVQGVASSSKQPGARTGSVSWQDASGNFWLFGGKGYDNGGAFGKLNDLWRWDGTNWTWISGSKIINQPGTYGTLNTAAAANIPGARSNAVGWIDSSGDFWLFGGEGNDSAGSNGHLSDLWRWDGANWTWVSGSNLRNITGTYGTKGIANNANAPGGRASAAGWIDASSNLWLFGGWGYDSTGAPNYLNDLWRWDGSDWTWISGSDTINETGNYGTQQTAANTNIPGSRNSPVAWKATNGDFWLFGGIGKDSLGATGNMNDLWRWDGADWTWMAGYNIVNQAGTYGTQQTAASANVPGSRNSAVGWLDSSGEFWLMGGAGYDSSGNNGRLSDLWHWNGSQWRWMLGSTAINESASYGTLNQHDATNTPGARFGSVGWVDSSDQLWLFGGDNGTGSLNDLWRYEP